jgi:hypothetical protein
LAFPDPDPEEIFTDIHNMPRDISGEGAQVTSVTTVAGSLVVFRHNVLAKRKKPARPANTLTLAAEVGPGSGTKEVARPVPILASRITEPEDPQVTFVYG